MVKSTAVCLNRNWNFAHLNDILIWCDITLYSISYNLRLLVPDGCDAHVNHCHISHLGPQLFDHSWAEKISKTVTSIIRISKMLNLYQGQSSCLSTVHFWNCHKPHRAGCGIWTWIWPKNWEKKGVKDLNELLIDWLFLVYQTSFESSLIRSTQKPS